MAPKQLVRVVTATLVAVVLGIGAVAGPIDAERAAPAAFDQYGGWTGLDLGATGAFRTQQVDGRWWLVTPEGHPFFSNGINHVTPEGTVDRNGHAAYLEAILAKHGSEDAWADAQIDRFDRWGVNTLGGWSDTGLFTGRDVASTVMLGFAGYSGGRIADVWSPGWGASVRASAASAAAAHRDDPWTLGYFLDNEVPWTDDWRKGPFTGFFGRARTEPGKQHLVTWLQARYPTFDGFTADFSTSATDWDSLLDAAEATPVGPGANATKDAWSGEVARRFFAITDDALTDADPDHLNLGVRFVGQLILPEVLDAAAAHVDVVSVNWYEIKDEWKAWIPQLGGGFLPTDDTLAAHRHRADLPFLISEFGWRAMDSGLPNTYPPLQVVVDTQQDRADAYRNFGACLANTGDVVGAHWFEMTDEPAIGRFDGEDDNWGMVTEADEEYALVTGAAAAVHDLAYAPLTAPDDGPQPCSPISDRVAVEPPPATTVVTTTTTPSPSTSTTEPTTATGSTAPAATPATAVAGSADYTG